MRLRAWWLAFVVSPTLMFAQSFTPVRELKNLSPRALETLHTLETLNALPAEEWRMHVGDLAHGEAVGLDDSAWTVVGPKSKAPMDAVWYRREIEVPKTLHGYDLTGARIWFQFRADANGPMPEIIYFNGRRVALGDDLEPIVLFEPARPGDKVLVAVKMLRTVDEKTFRGVSLRIEPAAGEHARPNPDDVRVQCITAANLLPELPAPRKDLLPTVEEAVAAIDTKALAAGKQAEFDRSLKHAQALLDTLHGPLTTASVVEAGNSHIDAAWLWPRSETIDVVKRTFTTALQLMNEYPDYTFTQSAAQYSEWMADKYPELNKQIAARVKEGRWEIVGGMWVEPDLNLPGGESLVRQLLVGQRYFQKEYGVVARIGWNPDSFGYNWQLPQIYKRSGLDYFVTQKMHWNDTNVLPFRLFWWESPDGSKVLTYFPTDYVHDNVGPTRISADFAESAQRNPGTREMLDLYGDRRPRRRARRATCSTRRTHWIDLQVRLARSRFPLRAIHTAQQYFSTTCEPKLNPRHLLSGTTSGLLATGIRNAPQLRGGRKDRQSRRGMTSFTLNITAAFSPHRQSIKRNMRVQRRWRRWTQRRWHRSRGFMARPYPTKEITDSWKKITFNQFHDLAAGSGIAVIYRDAQKDFDEVFRADREIGGGALKAISATADTRVKAGVPVIIFNAQAWPRSETVEIPVQLPEAAGGVTLLDARERPVPSQVVSQDAATHEFKVLARVKDVPALGYTVLHAVGTRDNGNTAGLVLRLDAQPPNSFVLRNAHLQVTVNLKTGCITSLMAGAKEFLAPGACGNQLQTYKDTPKQYDAWNIDPGTLDGTMTPISEVDSATVTERGPVRETVRIVRSWQSSKFIQDISLDADADMVEIANDVDWHETHVLLKAAFPLAASGPKATYEIPFGSIERPTTRNNTWEKAQFEVPALRWADLGDAHQGLSVINDSKYGYDALGNTLRLTLLRSPTWPDPDADRGRQQFRYALYPHAGGWKQALTVRHGYEFNDALQHAQVFAHSGTLPAEHSFGTVENANVMLTAMKKAEDANALVFRMYEWAGEAGEVKLHVPPGASYAVESNLMEKVEGPHLALAGDVVRAAIRPYEILTVQVFYPVGAEVR